MGVTYGGGVTKVLDRRTMLGCVNHGSEHSCALCEKDKQTIRHAPDSSDVEESNIALIGNASLVCVCMEAFIKSRIGANEKMMFSPFTEPKAAGDVFASLYKSFARFNGVTGILVASFDSRLSRDIHGPRIELSAERALTAPAKVVFELPTDIDKPMEDSDIIHVYNMENGPSKAREKFRRYILRKFAQGVAQDRFKGSDAIFYGSYGEVVSTDETLLGISDPSVDIEADTRIARHVLHFKYLPTSGFERPIVVFMGDNDVFSMTCFPSGGPDIIYMRNSFGIPSLNLSKYSARIELLGMDRSAHFANDLFFMKSDYHPGIKGSNSLSKARMSGMDYMRFENILLSPVKVDHDKIEFDLYTLHKMACPAIVSHGSEFVYELMHRYVWSFLYYMCFNPDPLEWGWSKTGAYKTPNILPKTISEPGYMLDLKLIVSSPKDNASRCTFDFMLSDQ